MKLGRKSFLMGLMAIGCTLLGCTQSVPTTNKAAANATATEEQTKEVVTETAVSDSSGSSDNSATPETPLPVNGFYSVDKYDKSRDASADLAATVKLAKTANKRILLEIGGDW